MAIILPKSSLDRIGSGSSPKFVKTYAAA